MKMSANSGEPGLKLSPLANNENNDMSQAKSDEEFKKKLAQSELEKIELIRERDQALEDLRNVESAFSDVHRKYERTKGVLETNRRNEEILHSNALELEDRLHISEAKINEFKDAVKSKLELMYSNYEAKIKTMELENTRLRAQLRKSDLKVETLENDVKQKEREVSKLNGLCDELINQKVQ